MSDQVLSGPGGAIHDIGYQRYTGPRLGRSYARRSLFVHSLRTAFGLGRTGRAKFFPWAAVGVMVLFAVIIDAIRSRTNVMVVGYVTFPYSVELVIVLFLASAAPELVSRDLRGKVLPLYFARPLSRGDYVIAKLAGMAVALWLIIAVPLVVIFLGGAFSLPGDQIWGEFTDFAAGLAAAAIIAVTYATIGLLIGSLIMRRMVAGASIALVFLVTAAFGGAVNAIVGGTHGDKISALFGPVWLTQSVNNWMLRSDSQGFGSYGWAYLVVLIVLVAICGVAMLTRYRRQSA